MNNIANNIIKVQSYIIKLNNNINNQRWDYSYYYII